MSDLKKDIEDGEKLGIGLGVDKTNKFKVWEEGYSQSIPWHAFRDSWHLCSKCEEYQCALICNCHAR